MTEREFKRKSCSTENFANEMLEEIWVELENDKREVKPGIEVDTDKVPGASLEDLIKEGYLARQDERLVLTDRGFERAKHLIRSHRLAERLLTDVLNFSDEEVERTACHYEHLLTDEAVDSVCTLLGHPRSCPHGKPIPQGRCCVEGSVKFRPLVVSLADLEPGEEAQVEYVGTRDNTRLAYLTSFGFVSGRNIKLIRKKPAFVVSVDESLISLDEELAGEIFVRPRVTQVKVQKQRRRGFGWRTK
jgi:DtxR family Mn-dependent transcriptional regulator